MSQETNSNKYFTDRVSVEQVEELDELAPKFDEHGLIPVVTTDAETGDVLMQGYMNQEAFEKSIELGQAVYYSRSRKCLWHKGATSGFYQHIQEFYIDDDQDCIWLKVKTDGGANCHVGYRSCFYRTIPFGDAAKNSNSDSGKSLKLNYTENEKVFDPVKVYGDVPNPTQL